MLSITYSDMLWLVNPGREEIQMQRQMPPGGYLVVCQDCRHRIYATGQCLAQDQYVWSHIVVVTGLSTDDSSESPKQ